MDSLEKDQAAGVLESPDPPCLSLYQPTHRRHPENQQDPIRFGNLVKELEASLLRAIPDREIQPLLSPFRALAEDRAFWNHTADGLAVLAARGLFRVYRLQRPVPELAVVADTLHLKPLLRILQSADRFQILGVSRDAIRLFEGNRDILDEIAPAPGVPRTLTEALGPERSEPHLTVASYGGVGTGHVPMRHGHGGRTSEVNLDTARFFRAVDRAVLEHHSRPTGLPLLLASLPEHHHPFHEASHNPFLLAESLDVHPDSLSLDALREGAWRLLEPRYRGRLDALREEFRAASANGLGDEALDRVAEAVVGGRVQTLLVEAKRRIPGQIDVSSGAIAPGDLAHPEVDDLLDDLAALALKRGGQVVVVPRQDMPTDTGVAATYRY